MDEIVKAALKKWPNVPACCGWLALDARGDWYMRDDRIQAAGPFPQVKGSRITHDKLKDFIHRNYEVDERGQWYFQNGPQRVYVELEAAPFVWRVHADPGGLVQVHAHTGLTRRRRLPGWTNTGGCSWTPRSASAWCTRWTWRRPPRRWSRASGRCRKGGSRTFPSASATC